MEQFDTQMLMILGGVPGQDDIEGKHFCFVSTNSPTFTVFNVIAGAI